MKKKLLIAAALAALIAVPVFAAANAQETTPDNWYNQMYQYHQQMVQRNVDNGIITQEQADQLNTNMQQMHQNGGMMANGQNFSAPCGQFPANQK